MLHKSRRSYLMTGTESGNRGRNPIQSHNPPLGRGSRCLYSAGQAQLPSLQYCRSSEMDIKLHKMAITTPRIRKAIQQAPPRSVIAKNL
jgi:hypothetical protein